MKADNVGAGNIDGGSSPFFKENGNYQATHTINMGFKKLLNLSMPLELFEVSTKEYVDNKEDAIREYADDRDTVIREYIDSKPQFILVNGGATGPLVVGKFQFNFGYDPVNSYYGFLVP